MKSIRDLIEKLIAEIITFGDPVKVKKVFKALFGTIRIGNREMTYEN